MERLLNWLAEEVKGRKVTFLILICVFFQLIYVSSLSLLLYLFFGLTLSIMPSGIKILVWYYPFLLLAGATIEEIIFRFPLVLLIRDFGKSKIVLYFAIFLSIIFGLVHGTIFAIIIQGLHGFILCLLFLKCGGFQKKYFKALTTTAISHFSYNVIVSLIALMLGYK